MQTATYIELVQPVYSNLNLAVREFSTEACLISGKLQVHRPLCVVKVINIWVYKGGLQLYGSFFSA